jgi:hypothetical protein
MEILEKCQLRFNHDKVHHYLELEWQFDPTSTEYIEALKRSISFIRKTNSTGYLIDMTSLKSISAMERNWTNNEWLPVILKLGIKKLALIVRQKTFDNTRVHQIAFSYQNFESRFFNNRISAIKWLKSTNK